MSSLDDLLNGVGTVVTKKQSNSNNARKSSSEIKLNYCGDVVLARDKKKYILGTNQLFPIYKKVMLGGGVYDVQLYMYTALSWNDMLYTDAGAAVHPIEAPDATLGYNCGIRVFNYRGGSPCIARSREERTLTVDDWCRLTYNAIPTDKVMPRLWKKADGGHEFWTPDEGFISALPVDIPMTLEIASEFKNIIGYRSGSDMLMTKISSMLYTYMRDNNIDKLYVGYDFNLSEDTETELIDAYEWSNTHYRRLGTLEHNHTQLFDYVAASRNRKLAIAIKSGTFSAESVFA
jgi:hypothetical protein